MSNMVEKSKEKELSRKKRSNFIKKVKRPFVKLIKYIKSINRTTKLIVGVWTLVLLIILVISLFVSGSNSSRQKYYDMEKAMDTGTLAYVEEMGIYPTREGKEIIPLEALLLSRDVYDTDVADPSCTGFSIVYYDDENSKYVVESYISCDKYTTKDYTENLEYGKK